MHSKTLFWLLVIIGILSGCSSDDNPDDRNSTSKVPSFILLAEDVENLFQFTYNGSTSEGETINLTEDSNIARRYLTLRQVGDVLSFYRFSSGNFSAFQRNVTTGETNVVENFYTISEDRSVIWGANSESKFVMAYFSPRGTSNLGIRIIDPKSEESIDLAIEFNISNVFDPLYFMDRLIIPYLDGGGNYKMAFINTITDTITETLNFGNASPSVLINDTGDMAVITGNNGNDYGYSVYDFNTLELKSEDSFSLNRFFSPGPLQADVFEGVLYYLNFYAQPSLVPFGPAVFNFNNKENRLIDMIDIVQQVQNELQTTISLTAFGYEENGNAFIVGYSIGGDLEFEGGALVISADGKLLDNISLPFSPKYIVQ